MNNKTNLIKIKCKEVIERLGFNGFNGEILSKEECIKKYPKFNSVFLGLSNWGHLTTGEIIFDSDKVNIYDKYFDRSLCHELYHAEFSKKKEYISIQYNQTDEYTPEILCLKFLSEVYAEKKLAFILPNGKLKGWDDILNSLKFNSIDYIISYNYNIYRNKLNPQTIEDYWNIITIILFIPINLISFFYVIDGNINESFKVKCFNYNDRIVRKILEYFQWFENVVIPVDADKLLENILVKKVIKKIKEVDKVITECGIKP